MDILSVVLIIFVFACIIAITSIIIVIAVNGYAINDELSSLDANINTAQTNLSDIKADINTLDSEVSSIIYSYQFTSGILSVIFNTTDNPALPSDVNVDISWSKSGPEVYLHIPEINFGTISGSTASLVSSAINASLFPAINQYKSIRIVNPNGNASYALLGTDGKLYIFKGYDGTSNFSLAALSSNAFSLNYSV